MIAAPGEGSGSPFRHPQRLTNAEGIARSLS